MIDAAIVGLGWWGRKIVDAVQGRSRKIRFVRGVTKEPEAARAHAERHGIPLCDELAEVLSDERVRAVALATPHSLHVDQIVASARAGRAVFCEKPLALTRAEAERAVEACRAHGVVLALGTNKRYWPGNRELRRVVASGVLGEILHVEGHYTNENSGAHYCEWRARPEETPGAGMTGAGIHVLDALVSVAGPVGEVYAKAAVRRPYPDALDTVSVVLQFASGVTGTLATVRSSTFYWRLHVFGEAGSAEAVGENGLVLRVKGRKPETLHFDPVDTLLAEFDAFADAAAGVAPYITSTDEMIHTVAALEAIVASIGIGQPIRVD